MLPHSSRLKGLPFSSKMHLVSPVKCLLSQLWQGGLNPDLTTQQFMQVETGKRICWRQGVLKMVMQPAALRAVCLFTAKHQQEQFEKDRNKRPKRSTGSLSGLFQEITTSLQHISIDLDGGMLAGCLGCLLRVVSSWKWSEAILVALQWLMTEVKGAGLIHPGEEKVKRVLNCCHPVHCPTGLHRRDELHELLLKSTAKKQETIGTRCNRENSHWTYGKKPLFMRVMQVWDRHHRGGEISVLGDSPDRQDKALGNMT